MKTLEEMLLELEKMTEVGEDFTNNVGKVAIIKGIDKEEHEAVILSVQSEMGIPNEVNIADLNTGYVYGVGVNYIEEYEILDKYYDPLGILNKKCTPIDNFDKHILEEGKEYEISAVAKVEDGDYIVSVTIDAELIQVLPLSDIQVKL